MADGASVNEDLGALGSIRAASGRSSTVGAALVLFLSLSGAVVSSFQAAVVAPLASSISAHFGGGDDGALIAQLCLTLPTIGVMIGGPLAAIWIGLLGYRPVLAGAVTMMVLAGTAGFYLESATLLLASRLLVGLSMVTAFSCIIALCGLLFRGETLSRLMGYQNGAGALMGMTLMLVSGQVASAFGWRASFLIYLVLAIFPLVALIAWLPPKAPRTDRKKASLAALRPMLPMFLGMTAAYSVIYMVVLQGSLLMAANGIRDPFTQSWVLALSTLTYAAMAMRFSWIETHVTKGWTLSVALALIAAGLFSLGGNPALWGAAMGSLLVGSGSGIASTWLIRGIVANAPSNIREQAVGFVAPMNNLGQFLNPLYMQPLRSAIGVQAALAVMGGVVLVVAGALALVRRGRIDK